MMLFIETKTVVRNGDNKCLLVRFLAYYAILFVWAAHVWTPRCRGMTSFGKGSDGEANKRNELSL